MLSSEELRSVELVRLIAVVDDEQLVAYGHGSQQQAREGRGCPSVLTQGPGPRTW